MRTLFMSNIQIAINNLNYSLPNGQHIFNNLVYTFAAEKIGLIGKNGIGKSTLLKLITGEFAPNSGSVNIIGKVAYCPQNYSIYAEQTIAEILAIQPKLEALDRIIQGSSNIIDFEILDEDWNIRERVNEQLSKFELRLDLMRKIDSLSGGEITRLMLAKQFISNPDFIILDEPTNNLDLKSRNLLYKAVAEWSGGLLIVSHDRQLLNLMDKIVAITALGIKTYGGNFNAYVEQKTLEQDAVARQLEDAKKQINKISASVQKTLEQHAKRQAMGNKLRKKGGQPKILLNAMANRSSKTQSAMAIQKEHLITDAQKKLVAAKERVEINPEIKISIPKTFVPENKLVLQIKNLTFGHEKQEPIINDFDLTIQGAERIAITGDNGSGKTTLLKLIIGELKPKSGNIIWGINQVRYLDQRVNLLDPNTSVLDNFRNFNPDVTENNARTFLAQFLFRNVTALKLVKDLSGGEKLRALLACILMAKDPPQLLILDEPTNHLDFESIASIESALKNYQGAILVVSHDEQFINNIGITRIVRTPLS